MEEDTVQSVSAVVSEMLQDGMKVIAVAQKEMGTADHITSADEQNLTLVGYLAFFDAPKKTARASIAALKRLKVTPKFSREIRRMLPCPSAAGWASPAAGFLRGRSWTKWPTVPFLLPWRKSTFLQN